MKFKKGDWVTINNNLDRTNSIYGSINEMNDMRGKTFQIERVDIQENCVKVNTYTWHPNDLTLVSETSETSETDKANIFHYDIESLSL